MMKPSMESGKKRITVIGIILLAIAAAGTSVYFFLQYRKSEALLKNPVEAAKIDNKRMFARIAEFVDLPADEEPTIANVTDKEKLADSPFFARAQTGDRVIFYTQAKRAILYRPSTGKIIEMNVMSDSGSQPEVAGASAGSGQILPTPTPSPAKKPTVAIYNGTTTPKLANNMEKLLTDKNAYAEVVAKENAAVQDYGKTRIIDLTGTNSQAVRDLSGLITAEISSLPAGEVKPEAEILIITGSDFTPLP